MPFTSQRIFYQSYQAKRFTVRISANGCDPGSVLVKVFVGKKPKAEVSTEVGYYSESRGYGGTSARKFTLTDEVAVMLCRAAIVNDNALPALVDELLGRPDPGNAVEAYRMAGVRRGLARWWLLAQQDNPDAFIAEERRAAAFANKKFKIGDVVMFHSRHGGPARGPFAITGERFDWHPYLGGGWRFGVPGIDAPQSEFRAAEQPVEVA